MVKAGVQVPAVPLQERALIGVPGPPEAPEVLYLNESQEAEVLEFIRESDPEHIEKLLVLKTERPEQYRRQLSLAYREMRELQRLKKNDPERYERVVKERELTRKSITLAREYREMNDEKKSKNLRSELQRVLSTLFDYRQMNRDDEIQRLENRLAELKKINDKR